MEGKERVLKHTAYFSVLPKPTLSRGMGVVCLNEQNGSVMLNSGACAPEAAGTSSDSPSPWHLLR